CCGASACSDACSRAAIGSRTDDGAYASGCRDSGSVSTMRGASRAIPQFGYNRKLMAMNHGYVGQFETELRDALNAAGLLRVCDGTDEGFAAARHDPTVYHDRLVQSGRKCVSGAALIAGERLIQTHEEYYASGNCDGVWNSGSSAGRR